MPELPRPGQVVRWRDPRDARACGWEDVFGPGPFLVVRCVDHSDHGLASGLILRTALGEHEIPEVWLALVAAPGCDSRSQAVSRRAGKSGDADTKRQRAAGPAPRDVSG